MGLIKKSAEETGKKLKADFEKSDEKAKHAFEDLGKDFKKAGTKIEDGFKKVGKAVEKTAVGFGKGVEETAKDIGHDAKDLFTHPSNLKGDIKKTAKDGLGTLKDGAEIAVNVAGAATLVIPGVGEGVEGGVLAGDAAIAATDVATAGADVATAGADVAGVGADAAGVGAKAAEVGGDAAKVGQDASSVGDKVAHVGKEAGKETLKNVPQGSSASAVDPHGASYPSSVDEAPPPYEVGDSDNPFNPDRMNEAMAMAMANSGPSPVEDGYRPGEALPEDSTYNPRSASYPNSEVETLPSHYGASGLEDLFDGDPQSALDPSSEFDAPPQYSAGLFDKASMDAAKAEAYTAPNCAEESYRGEAPPEYSSEINLPGSDMKLPEKIPGAFPNLGLPPAPKPLSNLFQSLHNPLRPIS